MQISVEVVIFAVTQIIAIIGVGFVVIGRLSRLEGRFDMYCQLTTDAIKEITKRHGT